MQQWLTIVTAPPRGRTLASRRFLTTTSSTTPQDLHFYNKLLSHFRNFFFNDPYAVLNNTDV